MSKRSGRNRSFHRHERLAIQAKLIHRRQRQQALAMSSPPHFRQRLALSLSPKRYLRYEIQAWQINDFQALDTAWLHLAGRASAVTTETISATSPVPIRRAYIERPRGHSKTSDMAIQIAWILLSARTPVNGMAAAADREQAALLLRAIQNLKHVNPTLCGDLSFVEGAVRNSRTGSRLDLISSDVRSSYGILPDFMICDELSHWPGPDLWYSLLSSAAKKPSCVLAVLTNAGVGRGWAWDMRENASRSPDWYFSSLDRPLAPWITEQSLAEQKAMLPPAVYERLWLNRWQHSDGEFVSLTEAEACIDPQLDRVNSGQPGIQYMAAIDYAEKHDFTVGVICHHDGQRIIVDRMDVVRPSPLDTTPTAWVEEWIEIAASRFPSIRFVIDEYQMLSLIQKLETNYSIKRFQFLGGKGNHGLAITLRQLILHRKVAWYPGCGEYSTEPDSLWSVDPLAAQWAERDDLSTELSSLLLRQSSSGRVRIDHKSDGIHHDDRSFALGAACLELVDGPEISNPHIEVTQPRPDGGFAIWNF